MAGKKILVADDSLTIQKVIRLALSGDGYEIQTVSDGKEALEQASLFRPDICIIDVSLPQFDAYEVREQLLSKPDLKNIPVILMSSAFEKVDETRAQSLGFAGHLIKPFDPSHLRSTLLSVSNQSPQNDPVSATINEPFIKLEAPSLQNLRPQNSGPHDLSSAMDDIQQMAKNTFEMSGLDQQEWGMIEPGKSPIHDTPYSHQEVSSIDFRDTGFKDTAPLQGYTPPPMDGTYGGMGSHQTALNPEELEDRIKNEVALAIDKMQNEMKDRLEQEFKSFTQNHLADMAERIIKEEIHKLLSDPPV